MLEKLYTHGITDILLEGGSKINAFLQQGAIDKYVVYIAPKVLGGNLSLTPFAGYNPLSCMRHGMLNLLHLIK